MPREDVPYPTSAICSIRERIAELRDELDQLLKTVNGVAGDANHDIKLVSGDPAIVINNDQAQHEIEIALDSSQLPAATVSSVNGQVGTVDLDGTDIPLNPGQSTPTVQNAVAANSGNITNLQNALAQEITDRGNADATLQTNINAANAAITGKVDKITTAGLSAYTHNGATQTEIPVLDSVTTNSIILRSPNARAQAADPASGATDKTLTTANWVSQTGDSAPNNLVHKSGNETISGTKTFTSRPNFAMRQYVTAINSSDYLVRLFMTVTANSDITFLQADSRSKSLAFVHIRVDLTNSAITANVTDLAGTQLPGIKYYLMEKDNVKYIAMDMAYHQGYTLMVLTQADFYGNNQYYAPLVDLTSTDATEIART